MPSLIKCGTAVLTVNGNVLQQPAIQSYGTLVTTIPVTSPVGVKVTSDRIFVISSSGLVSVFSLNTRSLITSFTVSGATTLYCDEVNNVLYVGGNSIAVYNLTTYAYIKTFAVAGNAGLAIQYATNCLWASAANMNVVDTVSGVVVKTITGIGQGTSYCNGISLDENGDRCFVPIYSSGSFKIIQISTGIVFNTIPVGSYGPTGVCISRSTNKILLASGNTSLINVVDYVNPAGGVLFAINGLPSTQKGIDCNDAQIFATNPTNNTISIHTNSYS